MRVDVDSTFDLIARNRAHGEQEDAIGEGGAEKQAIPRNQHNTRTGKS
jgi:hypothetical protein